MVFWLRVDVVSIFVFNHLYDDRVPRRMEGQSYIVYISTLSFKKFGGADVVTHSATNREVLFEDV